MLTSKSQYLELIKKVHQLDHAYYNLDNPMVSDDIYDALYRQLKEFELANPSDIDPSSPTQRVGGRNVEKTT